jgi:hypothetical protein
LTGGEISELYSTWHFSPTVDWLCGLVLWFTWFFDDDEACLAWEFTWLTTFDLNWYTWYSYTCAWVWWWFNDYCVTAEQTTGACGTMQSRNFYEYEETLDQYSSQYTYCSWGNSFQTWINYVEWDWRTRYCNWPTEFWPQAFCSAFEYQSQQAVCGPAHLQTLTWLDYSSWSSYLCTAWEATFFEYLTWYWRVRECNHDYTTETSVFSSVSCSALLSWWIGYISPSYTWQNPFEAISYERNDWQNNLKIQLLLEQFPELQPFFDIFNTYFTFFPQSEVGLTFYVPGIWVDSLATQWISTTPQWTSIFSSNYTPFCNSSYCSYVTTSWNTIKVRNSTFRSFLNVFVPPLFWLIYSASIVIFVVTLLTFPMLIIYPAYRFLSTRLFVGLDSQEDNVASFLARLIFWGATLVFSLVYLQYFVEWLPAIVENFKVTIWYFLTFILKLFFLNFKLMRTSVIAINYAFWTLFVWFILYYITKVGAKL